MAIERSDFLKLMEKQREREQKSHQATHTLLKQAALKVDHVTKNEHWDYFLELLQAKLDEATLAKMEWLERCGMANEATDWHQAQRQYMAFSERVRTLEEVMSLPVTLMNAAQ